MKILAIIIGIVLAAVICTLILVVIVRNKLRSVSKQVLGTEDLKKVVDAIQDEDREMSPKSVSGMDSVLMPKILRDFPDFDANMAKTYGREYIKKKLADKKDVTINRLVFHQYLPALSQKTIVMQASVGYEEKDRTYQTRYELHYAYVVESADETIAANCPNCGANLPFGATQCSYCGSRITNVLGNTWKFIRFHEI